MLWSIASAALGAVANGISARRANKINQRQYEEVRRYNTPTAQMSRFRAAGLNPHLIYSQTNEAEQRPEWRSPQFDFSALTNVPNELQSYQNIKESQSRVDNFKKQNELLDEQIKSLTIENRFKEEITLKQIAYLEKQIAQIDKAIENIDFEQAFKNLQLNNESIRAIWDFALRYATLGLSKNQFELEKAKFEEFKRQFGIQNRGSEFFDNLVKELAKGFGATGNNYIQILAKLLAEAFLNNFSS